MRACFPRAFAVLQWQQQELETQQRANEQIVQQRMQQQMMMQQMMMGGGGMGCGMGCGGMGGGMGGCGMGGGMGGAMGGGPMGCMGAGGMGGGGAPGEAGLVMPSSIGNGDGSVVHLEIPDGPEVHFLIGKGGGIIKAFEEQTGTRIQVNKHPVDGVAPNRRLVSIGGGASAEARQVAERLVRERMAEYRQIQEKGGDGLRDQRRS